MSNEILIRTAIRRQEAFRDLKSHLQTIKEVVARLDPHAEVYLFGSAAESAHTYSSDIDVLLLTVQDVARVHLELRKKGI